MRLSIVSYLDPVAAATVQSIQYELSRVTGSQASLKSWEPHVTIGDGIDVDDKSLARIQLAMQHIANQAVPFVLELRDIGTLDDWKAGDQEPATPFVIFLDIKMNDNLLRLVNRVADASSDLDKWYLMPQPYLPHCTLAFRDLTEEGLKRGIDYLRGQLIAVTTIIDHVALVEKLPDSDRELTRFALTALE